MKNKKVIIVVIILLSLIVIGLSLGFFLLINGNYNLNISFSFNESKANLIDSIEKDSNEIQSIIINTKSTDIDIKKNDEKIKVEYFSNTEKNPSIISKDGSITVDESKTDTSCLGFCNINRKVILYLPSSYIGRINIETTSGDIKSNIKSINDINIITTSGDIELMDISNANIKTTSGDITVDRFKSKTIIKSTSGNIKINKLKINESSNIETISGDVTINDNTCNCYVEASTISGDTFINKFDRKSDIVLKIKTTSGDIRVN